MDRIKEIVKGDRLFHLFGLELVEAAEGHAIIRAEVKEEFLNAHRIAHGGLVFALLDVAFALAVNSIIDAVGVQWSFNIFRSTSAGDHVKAEAKIVHKGKSLLVVEFKAESEKTGKLIAQGMATALPLSGKTEKT
ncbi:MAG: PaaI family thioesterase [Nitrospirae bacterium]|nr:PaaI family thioesterase [Nitrospirota bacterium]